MLSIIPERWKKRVLYFTMSAFVSWHTIALVMRPAPPEAVITKKLQPFVVPYTNFLALYTNWAFFAPVPVNEELFYTVTNSKGKIHRFNPLRGLRWYHPDKSLVRLRFRAYIDNPARYGAAVVHSLCAKHVGLKPSSLTLFVVQQHKEFLPEHHRAGKTTLDREFATKTTLGRYTCPTI